MNQYTTAKNKFHNTYMQIFYEQILMYVVIHPCFVFALLMSSNSMKIIKIDGNVLELWQVVCKSVILTPVLLLV